MEACEHFESSPIGQCAICEATVCGDCYRDLFATMICDQHEQLEDEGAWEMIGYYTSDGLVEIRRYNLEENGVVSLLVENEDEGLELYVPAAEKDDAYAVIGGDPVETHDCPDCKIQYSKELDTCPGCGVKAADVHGDVN